MTAYHIAAVAHPMDDAALMARWRQLLAASTSPERIYQSPEYFAYAQQHGLAGAALFAVTTPHSGELVGLIPVLERWLSLDFPAGRQRCFRLTLPSVVLLGSVALLPDDAALWRQVCTFLLARYPYCQALSLPAVPAPGPQPDRWPVLLHLPHGWRACHTTPLPADYAALLAQLGAKRRYNLKRQQRLLEADAGTLHLHRITQPGQVPRLSAALARLATPAQRRQWLSDAALATLARHGLLRSYVLECAQQPVALILALADGTTLHIHNILHEAALAHHSPGTTLLFLTIQDACQQGLRRLDFGYGSPAHSYQSINQTQTRGHFLLCRATLRNRALCLAHRLWNAALARLRAYWAPSRAKSS